MESISILVANGLRKTFKGTEGEIRVLKGLDLTVNSGEVIAILGASGVGKSTLLHILGTLDEPDSGRLELKGEDVFVLPANKINQLRNTVIGFIFQFHHLLPEFTALENVMMPSLVGGKSPAWARENASRLLELVGLVGRFQHRPGELSGGEQQRVAVARAFANDPEVILADEPTGNLDDQASSGLNDLILKLSRQEGKTFIVVTHKKDFSRLASRSLLLRDGVLHNLGGSNVDLM